MLVIIKSYVSLTIFFCHGNLASRRVIRGWVGTPHPVVGIDDQLLLRPSHATQRYISLFLQRIRRISRAISLANLYFHTNFPRKSSFLVVKQEFSKTFSHYNAALCARGRSTAAPSQHGPGCSLGASDSSRRCLPQFWQWSSGKRISG